MLRRIGLIAIMASCFSPCVQATPILPLDRPKTLATDLYYSGYIDGSYNYLVESNHFTSGVYDRYNDLAENGFTLQQAAVTFAYLPKQGLGGMFNALMGRDANALAPQGWDPYFGSQTLAMMVPQAYLQYAIGAYTFIGGLFDSMLGVESYSAVENTNFSRSILNGYAEPGITVGVRGTYAPTDYFSINAGVNNGWSGLVDRGRPPSIELGGQFTLHPRLSLMLQGLFGEQRLTTHARSGPKSRRDIVELVATFKATNALTLIVSGDYAVQSKALLANSSIGRVVWQGVTGYANYQLSEKWLASLRGEIYDDTQGYTTGVNQNWRELTLTLGYIPSRSWLIHAETRHDVSNKNAFVDRGGPGASHHQQSYALEVAYLC